MAATMSRSPFGTTVEQVLRSWSSLQLAVEQSFGGPDSREKAEWMVYAIETWFQQNDDIYPDELEDFLADVLNEEFDLILEDGTIAETARLICLFNRLCQENKEEEIQHRLQSLPKASLHNIKPDTNAAVEEMDSDDGEVGPSTSAHHQVPQASGHSQPSADASEQMETCAAPKEDDGWKVIRKGRRKK